MFPKYELRNTAIFVSPHRKINSYPARFHKQVEIMWVRKNNVKVTIGTEKYTLNEGDVYVVFPNVLHSLDSGSGDAMLVIADDDYFISYREILSHFKPKNPVLRAGEFPKIVYDLLERICEVKSSSNPQRENTVSGYIAAVLGELLCGFQLIERSADNDLVQKLILYLLDNYTRQITLEDIARELNYNKYYISHVIADTFKCNFRVLVNSYRVSMAQNMLASSERTVSEIAYDCGFKNQSSFNRIFLKHCGVTPSEYRKTPEEVPEKPTVYEKVIDNVTGRCYNIYAKGNEKEK